MTIPTLLPDELARGYLGRVARMNKLRDLQQTYSLLGAALPIRVSNGQSAGVVHVLSELARVSPDIVIGQHTLLPFTKAVRRAGFCGRYSEYSSQHSHAVLTYPYTNTKDFRLCPRCVQEDKDFHGVTFWRRSHQLKGVAFCSKHGCGLHSANIRQWSDLPEDLLGTSQVINRDIVDESLVNPVIRRYEEICSTLALRARPLPMEAVHRLLRDRALEVCSPTPRSSVRITPLASERVSGSWLTSEFPGLQERRRTGYTNSLDRIVGSSKVPLATQYYALALALLFGTSDEAMYRVTQAELDAYAPVTPVEDDAQAKKSMDRLSVRLGDARRRAIDAILAGSSIREAAKVAGLLGSDLEALVIACASERLTQLSQKTH